MAPLRRFPWHPLLLPIVYVYGFYLATAAPVEWLFRPVLTGVLLSTVLYAVCRLAFRDLQIAALGTSGLLLVFAGFGWYPLLLGAAAAVIGLFPVLRRWRAERMPWLDRRTINRAADTVTGVLLLILIVQGLPHLASPARAAEPAPALAGAGPNIQIIILDGYARGDTLAEWGFDNAPFLASLELALLQKTVAAGLFDIVAPDLLPALHRSRVEEGLRSLAGMGDRPRFTFAHFVTPHPPFIYAADDSLPDQAACFPARCSFYGGSSAELSMSNEEFQQRYTGQIAGLNPVVLDALDAIIAADPGAVIVLMSDHGSRFDGTVAPLERYRPLFAARTPGHPNLFGEAPSNTQALAVLLNAYLDAGVRVPTNQRFEEYGPLDVSPLPEQK